jgi:hypothetical protein
MSRLVRVRYKDDIPEGFRAFAVLLRNGGVILYVSTRLNAIQRNIAARKALRAVSSPRHHRKLALVPLAGLLPWPRHPRARLAALSVAGAGAALGLALGLAPAPGSPVVPMTSRPLVPSSRAAPPTRHRVRGKSPGGPVPTPSPVGYTRPSGDSQGGSGTSPQVSNFRSPSPVVSQPRPGGTGTPQPSVTSTPVPSPQPSSSASPTPTPRPSRSTRCILTLRLGKLVWVCL